MTINPEDFPAKSLRHLLFAVSDKCAAPGCDKRTWPTLLSGKPTVTLPNDPTGFAYCSVACAHLDMKLLGHQSCDYFGGYGGSNGDAGWGEPACNCGIEMNVDAQWATLRAEKENAA